VILGPDPRDWPEAPRYWWLELSGQIQHDGAGCSRAEADRRAELEVRRRWAAGGDEWVGQLPALPGRGR
jgi:hypothetical protein